MSIPFATDAWAKALMAEINSSPSYAEAAKNWEGDFYFIIEGENHQEQIIYIDLRYGQAYHACAVDNVASFTPAFTLTAPLAIWQEVLQKRLDPIRGIMLRKLHLTGNMMQVLKAPQAATELVACAIAVDTDWSE